MVNSTLDKEDLVDAAGDGYLTTDVLNGSRQNLELLTHYASMNERSGMSGANAAEMAIEQFNDGHSKYENPDGTEIAIPVQHKILNPTGLLMFAKGNADIASRINQDNMVFLSDFRINRQIGMRKAPDFNVSKDYLLTYDDQVVTGARFKYEDYTEYIGALPAKDQREVDKTINKSRLETIEDARESRKKRVKALRGTPRTIDYGQFSFEVRE